MPKIPEDIKRRVLKDFPEGEGEAAFQHLIEKIPDGLANGTRYRHLRGIVYLSKGNLELMDHYIEICLRDARDLMVAAEYDNDVHARNFQNTTLDDIRDN